MPWARSRSSATAVRAAPRPARRACGRGRGRSPGRPRAHPEPDRQRDEVLLGAVVQVTLDAAAAPRIGRRHEPGPRGLQLVVAPAQVARGWPGAPRRAHGCAARPPSRAAHGGEGPLVGRGERGGRRRRARPPRARAPWRRRRQARSASAAGRVRDGSSRGSHTFSHPGPATPTRASRPRSAAVSGIGGGGGVQRGGHARRAPQVALARACPRARPDPHPGQPPVAAHRLGQRAQQLRHRLAAARPVADVGEQLVGRAPHARQPRTRGARHPPAERARERRDEQHAQHRRVDQVVLRPDREPAEGQQHQQQHRGRRRRRGPRSPPRRRGPSCPHAAPARSWSPAPPTHDRQRATAPPPPGTAVRPPSSATQTPTDATAQPDDHPGREQRPARHGAPTAGSRGPRGRRDLDPPVAHRDHPARARRHLGAVGDHDDGLAAAR